MNAVPRDGLPKTATHDENVLAVKAEVDVDGPITLEELKTTLRINAMSISRMQGYAKKTCQLDAWKCLKQAILLGALNNGFIELKSLSPSVEIMSEGAEISLSLCLLDNE